jgi:hypothetical protein
MLKDFSLLILVVFLLFIVNALSVSAEDNKCAPVFKSTCQECHTLERGCEQLGQSQKELKELFEFMEEMGADISDDEQALLIDCLSKPDDGIKVTCQK